MKGLCLQFGDSKIIATVSRTGYDPTLPSTTDHTISLNYPTNIIHATFNNSVILVGNVLDDKFPNLDMDFDFGFEEDEESAQEIADVPNPNPPGFEVFADVGGGSFCTKTGN